MNSVTQRRLCGPSGISGRAGREVGAWIRGLRGGEMKPKLCLGAGASLLAASPPGSSIPSCLAHWRLKRVLAITC